MPRIGNNIYTKVRDVRYAQSTLYVAMQEPESVEQVWVDIDLKVHMRFMAGYDHQIGRLHPKYGDLRGKPLALVSWKLTGGKEQEEDMPIQMIGCNLHLRTIGDAGQVQQGGNARAAVLHG